MRLTARQRRYLPSTSLVLCTVKSQSSSLCSRCTLYECSAVVLAFPLLDVYQHNRSRRSAECIPSTIVDVLETRTNSGYLETLGEGDNLQMNTDVLHQRPPVIEPEDEAVSESDYEDLASSRRTGGSSCRTIERLLRRLQQVRGPTTHDRSASSPQDGTRDTVGCPHRTVKEIRVRRSRGVMNDTR